MSLKIMEKDLVCAFTGHRNLNSYELDYESLRETLYTLLHRGFNTFYCGMAMGFDMAAAECLLEFHGQYNFRLVAVVPCVGQADKFSLEDRGRYKKILGASDEVITLSDEYYSGCMQARDRYMVDNCDLLLAFLRKRSGGTYYTVGYAKKRGKPVVEI